MANKIITRNIFIQVFVAYHWSHGNFLGSRVSAISKHDKSELIAKASIGMYCFYWDIRNADLTFHNFTLKVKLNLIFGDLFITNIPNSAITATITYFSDFPFQESGSFWEATCCDTGE